MLFPRTEGCDEECPRVLVRSRHDFFHWMGFHFDESHRGCCFSSNFLHGMSPKSRCFGRWGVAKLCFPGLPLRAALAVKVSGHISITTLVGIACRKKMQHIIIESVRYLSSIFCVLVFVHYTLGGISEECELKRPRHSVNYLVCQFVGRGYRDLILCFGERAGRRIMSSWLFYCGVFVSC